jgi:hypothetical protein
MSKFARQSPHPKNKPTPTESITIREVELAGTGLKMKVPVEEQKAECETTVRFTFFTVVLEASAAGIGLRVNVHFEEHVEMPTLMSLKMKIEKTPWQRDFGDSGSSKELRLWVLQPNFLILKKILDMPTSVIFGWVIFFISIKK